jgi:electron-transferring-flavoprotein dehydrogenase
MKSGMLAAETLFECLLAGDFSKERLAGYEKRVDSSWAGDEMKSVRNFHQGFEHGMYAGMLNVGAAMFLGGRDVLLRDRVMNHAGHEKMETLAARHPNGKPAPLKFDGVLTFDKLADVYLSGTSHDEDQPVHLLVADTSVCATVPHRVRQPVPALLPAAVYEMVPDEAKPGGRLQINASNCVHCRPATSPIRTRSSRG